MKPAKLDERIIRDVREHLSLDDSIEFDPIFTDTNGEEFLVTRVIINDKFGKQLYDLAVREEHIDKLFDMDNDYYDEDEDGALYDLVPYRVQNDDSLISTNQRADDFDMIAHFTKAEYSNSIIDSIKARCRNDVIAPEINFLSVNDPPTYITNWLPGTPYEDLKEIAKESITDFITQTAVLNKHNLVHLDLHDRNVLQDYAGRSVIIDWSAITAVKGPIYSKNSDKPLNLANLEKVILRHSSDFSTEDISKQYYSALKHSGQTRLL